MTRAPRRAVAVGALMLAVSVVCTGVPTASPGATTAPAAVGGTLVQRISGDWTTLDPFDPGSATANTGQILVAVYDRLLILDDKAKVLPYLAASWQQTPTSATFKLRTDATCSDGDKVTATAVANSFKRMLDPQRPGPGVAVTVGPGPYSVTADDAAATVTVTWGKPNGDALLAIGSFPIVCPAGLANPAGLAQTPVGSGPYTIASALHGDKITLKARPEWKWGPNGTTSTTRGFPKELIYRVVANDTTAANLLITGDLDLAIVKGPDVLRLRQEKSLVEKKAQTYTVDVMQFNENPARVTSDVNVRHALETAVDPSLWNKAMNNNEGVLSSSILTPNHPCFEPATSRLMPTVSIDNARAILLANGYVRDATGKLSKNGKPFALNLLGNTTNGSGPEYLLSQFTQLGATVTLQNLDFSSFAVKYRNADYDVTVGNLSFSTPQPINHVRYYTGPFLAQQGNNFQQIADPVLDQLVSAAVAATEATQCQNWAAVQRRLREQHHVLPMAGQVTSIFARTGFDFSATANNSINPWTLRAPAK